MSLAHPTLTEEDMTETAKVVKSVADKAFS
jgi:hypothetical protein